MTNFIKSIKRIICFKFAKMRHKLSQPKCPNAYRCPDCIHCRYVFDGIEFKGIYCDIDSFRL